MKNISRRIFVKTGLVGAFTALFSNPVKSNPKQTFFPTPSETEGPFYPVYPQKDRDFDLTSVAGSDVPAKGRAIYIEGRVVDIEGNPIEDAVVDLWQANAAGRYRHPRDPNRRAPLDPNFQGWAIVPSGKDGYFRFKTIYPGIYPAAVDWFRPPHIHFKISKPGYEPLTTQMYFPDEKLNEVDLLLINKTDEEKELMIAILPSTHSDAFEYNIVLKRA